MRKAVVRTGLGQDVDCRIPDNLAIQEGNECLIETERILDYGKILKICECEAAAVQGEGALPAVVRRATLQDQSKEQENALRSKIARDKCVVIIEKHDLPMRLVKVWYSFDRNILRLLFSADERVDFRPLIKDISAEIGVRVDVRQLGVRDEAGMIGGVATCGRPMCCCSWLEKFESINVRMAKAQNLSLNPGAISGMCGRLKCCMKFEYDTYVEEGKLLPREGRRVHSEDGDGVVIDRNVLRRRVKVRFDDNSIKEYSVDDLTAG